MPQVGVQQPSNLMEMYSSPSPMLWDIASGQVKDQTLGNALNRAQAEQDMKFSAQKQPFELSRMGLENQGLEADLPGRQAESSLKQDKATISKNTLSEQQRATLSDLAAKVSNNDLLEAENAVKTALTHPSAAVRQQANAMWEQLSHVKEIKMKQEEETRRAVAHAEALGQNALSLENQQYQHGKYDKKWSLGIEARLDNINDPVQKYQALLDAAQQARQKGDEDSAERFTARAAQLENLVKAKLAAASAKPGAVDIGQVGGIPTNPALPVAPNPTPKQTAQPKTQEEYNALPSGTIYIDNDGKTKRKK